MALTIYRIEPDFAYWRLLPSDPNLYKIGDCFALKEMGPTWPKPSFYIKDPVRQKQGDFVSAVGGGLTFRSSVLHTPVGGILGSSGELLEATLEETGEQLLILNPMVCYNCFDRSKAEFRTTPDGTVFVQIFKYAFHRDRIGLNTLFKIPETFRIDIYTSVEHDGEPDEDCPADNFYAHYHASGLTGLRFEKIWTSGQS